jgi:DNA-binding transcriptional regulator YhcF (GntR family)
MDKIKRALRSPVKKKIIVFFHENPQAVDSVRGISTWINIKPNIVKKALEGLVREGILVAHRGSTTTGYAYTQDRDMVSRIESYLYGKSDSV